MSAKEVSDGSQSTRTRQEDEGNARDGIRAMSSLADVKILDFTHMHAGTFASMILADLGAEVLKVEPPFGDETRRMTRFSYGDMSAFFVASNRNKHSLVMDLRDPSTRPALDALIVEADIVIDNFRPSTLRRMNLHYDHIRTIKPDVISVSISGYGEGSPEADSPAYDLLAQARAGIMSLTGEADGPPLKAGAPFGDLVVGIYGAVGALAALHERSQTGDGQRVEVAMLDAQLAMVHYHYSYFDASGVVLPRVGSDHQNMVPYGTFRCKDGYLAIAAVPEPPKFWQELCRSLGHPEWIEDPRFSTADARHDNRVHLKAAMEEVLTTETRHSWFQRLSAWGVPVAPVNTVDDLLNDQQVRARDMLVEIKSSDYGVVRVPGNPIKMPGALRIDKWIAPPVLGEWQDAAWKMREEELAPSDAASDPSPQAFDFSLVERRAGPSSGEDDWVLLGWDCHSCERVSLGCPDRCPSCGSPDGKPTVLSDHGTLETWSRIMSTGGSYIVGYALLGADEKPDASVRVFARIEDTPEESLTLGMPVNVAFEASEIDGSLLVHHFFVPGCTEVRAHVD